MLHGKIILGVAAAMVLMSGSALAAGDAAAGATTFKQCAACHPVKAGEKRATGPNLVGVVGRAAGTGADYAFSEAMKGSKLTWDEATLSTYLADPKAKVPGTKMAFPGLKKPEDVANVIAYLGTLK